MKGLTEIEGNGGASETSGAVCSADVRFGVNPDTDAGSAALPAVMLEQLEYLISHAAKCCSPGCSECARLDEVKNWLLRPFRVDRISPKVFSKSRISD